MIVMLRPTLFRRAAVIGVGLIGGSLAKAMRKNKVAKEIVGVSQGQATLNAALKDGVIDQGFQDAAQAVNNADLVILAAPVAAIEATLGMIGPHLRRGCIVTDVGSSKLTIVRAAHKFLPQHVFFIGSHPLAGSEKVGVQNASAELFQNATCILTPVDATPKIARERIKQLWTKVGAHVKSMTPEEHDRALGYVSHLPHMVAYALMGAVPQEMLSLAAQGLKDTTRIAASSPQMWNDIAFSNRKVLVKAIDEVTKNLSVIRKAITSGDQKALLSFLKDAKTKREHLH